MALKTFSTVDEYMAALPQSTRAALEKVRSILHAAIPAAEEVISYGIPAVRLGGGRPLLWFAGWKEHYSLYPVNGAIVARLGAELSRYELGKGTLRFRLSEPTPVKLIERIAKLRVQEGSAKGASPAPTRARGTTAPASRSRTGKVAAGRVSVPTALREALKAEPRAQAVFDSLAPSHRQAYTRWIASAKRAETQGRRASSAVQMLLRGKPPA